MARQMTSLTCWDENWVSAIDLQEEPRHLVTEDPAPRRPIPDSPVKTSGQPVNLDGLIRFYFSPAAHQINRSIKIAVG
jgi:hypothetical protein